jgi:hypothetical protein
MRTAQSLDRMARLLPEVAEEERTRYREIIGFFEASPRTIPSSWVPQWSRVMIRARRDLGAILCRCCRDHHGEELARELLARIPVEDDPLD